MQSSKENKKKAVAAHPESADGRDLLREGRRRWRGSTTRVEDVEVEARVPASGSYQQKM
jgi:hypothetical protein